MPRPASAKKPPSRTTITKGKQKRFRGQIGRRKDVKKAYVTLEEGPHMLTNIVDCNFDQLEIGQKVTVTFQETEGEGPSVPVFTPAS